MFAGNQFGAYGEWYTDVFGTIKDVVTIAAPVAVAYMQYQGVQDQIDAAEEARKDRQQTAANAFPMLGYGGQTLTQASAYDPAYLQYQQMLAAQNAQTQMPASVTNLQNWTVPIMIGILVFAALYLVGGKK